MFSVEHKGDNRENHLEGVCQHLSYLSDFDSLTQEEILENLEALLLLTENNDLLERFHTAVEYCHRAVYFDLGTDPLIEEWALWPPRYAWLVREFQDVKQQLDETANLSKDLLNLRERFEDDGHGYPKNAWHLYQKSLARKFLVYSRVTLYRLGQQISLMDSSTLDQDCVLQMAHAAVSHTIPDQTEELFHRFSQTLHSPFSREDAWYIYALSLQAVNSMNDESQYYALRNIDSNTREQVLRTLQLSLYSNSAPAPKNFWNDLETAQKRSRTLSPNYPEFAVEDLQKLVNEGKCSALSLRVGKHFVAGAFIMTDTDKFLSRSHEKLKALGEIVLPPLSSHTCSWLFINVTSPTALMHLRHHRIDWSLLLRDAVTDIALSCNRESLLGLVEAENPAVKAHLRVGFTPLATKKSFKSDGGKDAQIWRRGFYSPFKEE